MTADVPEPSRDYQLLMEHELTLMGYSDDDGTFEFAAKGQRGRGGGD